LDWDQATAIGTILLITLSVVSVLSVLFRLVKSPVASIPGAARRPESPQTAPAAALANDPELTAAALGAIRSNLGAVSRQIEDLEKKLRSSASTSVRAARQRQRNPGVPGNDEAACGAPAVPGRI
jgi:hypothetical protein